jgi:hypothetical protein
MDDQAARAHQLREQAFREQRKQEREEASLIRHQKYLADNLVKLGKRQCWEWIGPRNAAGYGRVSSGTGKERRTTYAHRYFYTEANGPIPEGMLVCHKCDNPPCCNPHHLFLGTRTDNQRDRVAKGRTASAFERMKPQIRQEAKILISGGIRYQRVAQIYRIPMGKLLELLEQDED